MRIWGFLTLMGVPLSVCFIQANRQPDGVAQKGFAQMKAEIAAKWVTALEELENVHASRKAVNAYMNGKYRDRGQVAWGGTGAYSEYFLLDDFHQIRIDFDLDEHVTGFDVGPNRRWLKGPDGVLILE